MKTLTHILILSLIVAGAFFPPIWILLIILATLREDSDIKKHNDIQTELKERPYAPPNKETLNLNIHKVFKQEYLKSPEWNIKRKLILKRDNYTCVSCNSNVPLEVHHITYIRFGNESNEDLVSLCRECHQAIHTRLGYDYNNTFPISS